MAAGYEPVPAEGRKLFELIAAAVHEHLLASLGASAGWWSPRMCSGLIRPPWRFWAACWAWAGVGYWW